MVANENELDVVNGVLVEKDDDPLSDPAELPPDNISLVKFTNN